MPTVRFDTVPRRHLPHLDGLIPTRRNDEISSRHKRYAGYIMIVTQHRTYTLEGLLEIPQFDAHVRATGHQKFAGRVERDVLDTVRVTFECTFEFAGFEVPNLDGGIFACRYHQAEDWVKNYSSHRRSMTCNKFFKRYTTHYKESSTE